MEEGPVRSVILSSIEFYRDYAPRYRKPEPVGPAIVRVVAENPNDYTWLGTNTYLIGERELIVLDPGPAQDAHIEAVLAAVDHRPVKAVLLTHTHLDHSPAAPVLGRLLGAPVLGHSLVSRHVADASGEDVDLQTRPDRFLADGERIDTADISLEAIHTPGHFPNHLCYALGDWLFSGDHVMGWATSVITPPLGNLCDYLASLDKLLARRFRRYLPSHGPAIEDPDRFVRQVIAHRHARTQEILACLKRGISDPAAIVAEIYQGLSPRLVIAAKGSVRAHLDHLDRRRGLGVAAE